MDCNSAELSILEHGADLPADVSVHVAGCPSCREFARVQQALLDDVAGVEPSPALDRAVLAAAHHRLRRGWRRLPRLRLVYRAAAAALVLATALGVLLHRRPEAPARAAVATAVPAVPEARHWAGAQVDLAAIEGGLDAALAELETPDTPGHGPDAEFDIKEPWDALMELEFDVYFESESLRQAGG